MRGRGDRVAWGLILGVALVLRLAVLDREGLWVDEVFSLAVATGHSIEQDPRVSRPELGDFVEPGPAVPPSELRRYLRHDSPPAGPYRVVRATFISDTSPPLYYVLLWAWTLALGTSDVALRLFSVAFSLATLPVLWALGREAVGERAALLACAFFAVVPVGLEAGIEGRMYALTIFLGTLLAWTSVALARRGWRPGLAILWSATAAAGMLTHYFFVFVWAACAVWLLLSPGRLDRRAVPALSALAALLAAPWYLRMPEILGHWRVAKGWLDGLPSPRRFVVAPINLAVSLFSLPDPWRASLVNRTVLAVLVELALLLAAFLLLRRAGRAGWKNARALPVLWLVAACCGPLIFDLACRSQTDTISRYAWPALPAAALLAGMAGARLAARPRRMAIVGLLLLLAWVPAYYRLALPVPRHGDSFRETGALLSRWARPGDLVIVHSIPSGVLGLVRYLGDGPRVASWVPQLRHRRVPEDTLTLTTGERRVALVEVHEINAPAPEETWLRRNASLTASPRLHDARLFLFDLDAGRLARGDLKYSPAPPTGTTAAAFAAPASCSPDSSAPAKRCPPPGSPSARPGLSASARRAG
jgi:4-amino-4-deoxy-L-arabinose transferase-like glycosyltransferase